MIATTKNNQPMAVFSKRTDNSISKLWLFSGKIRKMTKLFAKENKRENQAYLIFWAIVFIVAALVEGFQDLYLHSFSVDFKPVGRIWIQILPFLVLFVAHNYLVAPLLTERGKTLTYIVVAIAALLIFQLCILLLAPEPAGAFDPRGIDPGSINRGGGPPPLPSPERGRGGPGPDYGPNPPEFFKVILAAVMTGANLAAKFYFRSLRSAKDMQELEKENLQHQLEYLRYQINPHFFMNTLNNIHALVDIDPDKAKESIVELSKLMRHILYDSNLPTIPLSQETDYLEHYVALMKIRFGNNVQIRLSFTDKAEDVQVPPLIYASFVENAFKHGVDGSKPSFVRVSVAEGDGKVIFRCSNSRFGDAKTDKQSGIGLDNERRRLKLLYGDDFTLHIDETQDVYDVLLVLPRSPAL